MGISTLFHIFSSFYMALDIEYRLHLVSCAHRHTTKINALNPLRHVFGLFAFFH